jgi:hypothetical protein
MPLVSAVDAAISCDLRVAVASQVENDTSAEPPSLFEASSFEAALAYDVDRREAFNRNPRENQGRQIDQLVVDSVDDETELTDALNVGVGGAITNDIPALRRVAERAGACI